MPNVVVVGAQWGDEGKGKVVDLLTEHAQVVVRFQGATTPDTPWWWAGRRPSSPSSPAASSMREDLRHRQRRGPRSGGAGGGDRRPPRPGRHPLGRPAGHLRVGARHLPWHKHLDALRERARGASPIGTTGRGIGPTYEDKVARRGIRVRDLLDDDRLFRKVEERLPGARDELAALAARAGIDPPTLDAAAIAREYAGFGARLRPTSATPRCTSTAR